MYHYTKINSVLTTIVLVILGIILFLLSVTLNNRFISLPAWERAVIVKTVNLEDTNHEIEILDYLRTERLQPYDPEKATNYTSTATWKARHWGQLMPKFVIQRLGDKENGLFIECGAFDGFFISNTVLLEREYGWRGLLIEADPAVLPILKKRNRKAYVADVCLSPESRPMNLTMKGAVKVAAHGYIENDVIANSRRDLNRYSREFQVQCYPLAMLLDAIGVDQVDYFSLDVEGVELDILKTIPWHRIHIKIISVEVRPANRIRIQNYLESVGYKKIKQIVNSGDMIHDDVYEI